MKLVTECYNFKVKKNIYECKVKGFKVMGMLIPEEVAYCSKEYCAKCKQYEVEE
jgi:hypothetical protein